MTGPSTSPSATWQDGEGLVSVRLLREACRVWARYMNDEDDSGAVTTTERSALKAVLAAVAPDIAAQARRECAEELRAFASKGSLPTRSLFPAWLRTELRELAARWSGSGRAPADEG